MKKQFAFFSSLIVVMVCGMLSLTQQSCSKKSEDPCAGVICQHGGTCADGTCTCPTGYSGANCETPFSANYAGTYTGADSLLNSDTIIIASDTGAYGVSINAKSKNVSFKGTLSHDTLTIPNQTVGGVVSYSVSGSGIFNLPNARISYTIVSTGTNHVVFTGHK